MQKLLARCCLVIVLVGATVSGVGARAADGTEAAVSAAEAWLAHMDGADYAAGWRDGAAIMKAAVTVKEFARALASARTPLGQLISRILISKQRTRSLPGRVSTRDESRSRSRALRRPTARSSRGSR